MSEYLWLSTHLHCSLHREQQGVELPLGDLSRVESQSNRIEVKAGLPFPRRRSRGREIRTRQSRG